MTCITTVKNVKIVCERVRNCRNRLDKKIKRPDLEKNNEVTNEVQNEVKVEEKNYFKMGTGLQQEYIT